MLSTTSFNDNHFPASFMSAEPWTDDMSLTKTVLSTPIQSS